MLLKRLGKELKLLTNFLFETNNKQHQIEAVH
jgi:hypothetical protein